jgi:hypothetical protein
MTENGMHLIRLYLFLIISHLVNTAGEQLHDDFDAHILNLLEARDSIHLTELQVRMLSSPRGRTSSDQATGSNEAVPSASNAIDGLFIAPEESDKIANQ